MINQKNYNINNKKSGGGTKFFSEFASYYAKPHRILLFTLKEHIKSLLDIIKSKEKHITDHNPPFYKYNFQKILNPLRGFAYWTTTNNKNIRFLRNDNLLYISEKKTEGDIEAIDAIKKAFDDYTSEKIDKMSKCSEFQDKFELFKLNYRDRYIEKLCDKINEKLFEYNNMHVCTKIPSSINYTNIHDHKAYLKDAAIKKLIIGEDDNNPILKIKSDTEYQSVDCIIEILCDLDEIKYQKDIIVGFRYVYLNEDDENEEQQPGT